MKQIFLGALIVGITALSACSNETRPASDSAAKGADSAAKPAMLAQPSTTPATQPGATTLPTGANPATNAAVPKNPDGTVAKNPPHGQPNHRCDIPVGAPLDSPPGPNAGGMGSSGSPIQVTPGNGNQTVQVQPQTVQVNPQAVQVNPQTTPVKPQTATKP